MRAFGWTFSWMKSGGGLYDEVRPVLLVLPPPHELRVEVAVATLVRDLDGASEVLLHHRLVLRGRDVLPRCLTVGEGLYGLRLPSSSRHLPTVPFK